MRRFIGIRQILMGYMAADTHTHKHTQGNNNSLANPFGARLILSYIARRPCSQGIQVR